MSRLKGIQKCTRRHIATDGNIDTKTLNPAPRTLNPNDIDANAETRRERERTDLVPPTRSATHPSGLHRARC